MEIVIGIIILVALGYVLYVANVSKSEAGVKVEQAEAAPYKVETPVVVDTTVPIEVKTAAVAETTVKAKKATVRKTTTAKKPVTKTTTVKKTKKTIV